MVSARLVFLAALRAADHQTNFGPADPDVPQEGIVHCRKGPFRHTVNPVIPERAVSCSHYRHCNTPLIGAAGCSGAIAFKPSLFQAFFRADSEVFRLFQRRGALPTQCEFRAARVARVLVMNGETGARDQPRCSRVRWQHREPAPSPSRRLCSVLERRFPAAMLHEHQPPSFSTRRNSANASFGCGMGQSD